MSIGSKVRKYRMYKGLSQRILAENADVSQSIISSLESDKSIPNSVMLNRIAKELDVDINELLVDENIVQVEKVALTYFLSRLTQYNEIIIPSNTLIRYIAVK